MSQLESAWNCVVRLTTTRLKSLTHTKTLSHLHSWYKPFCDGCLAAVTDQSVLFGYAQTALNADAMFEFCPYNCNKGLLPTILLWFKLLILHFRYKTKLILLVLNINMNKDPSKMFTPLFSHCVICLIFSEIFSFWCIRFWHSTVCGQD